MKNKNMQYNRPLHLHIEYMLRHQYVVIAVIGLLFIGLVKADLKMITMMRDTYVHSFGVIGQYLREETTRSADTVSIGLRSPTISGE